ncbi:MAG: nitrate ABC transporter permease [candidate division NC10 bacterium RIFCSPLOWO2_12_FULL_66_18]|nr:MAG: nitrate ABC transporter permease [candidate division NC10 bacterium RIFCSPLOWO2_12_FULL_66_18]
MSRAGWIRVSVVVAAVAAVELLCQGGIITRFTMIPPSEMVVALAGILTSGRLTPAIVRTLRIVGIALAASILVGFVLGALLHALPRVRRTVDPLFATYYAIPIYAFYPLFIVLFGLGDVPIIIIGFLLAVVAMIVSTLNGFDRIPRALLKTARIYRMGRVRTALQVMMPCAAPYIFTGVKLAIAYSFIGVIGAEFIMSGSGMGYEIAFAYNNFDNKVMYPLIMLVLVLVTIINMFLHFWEMILFERRRRG